MIYEFRSHDVLANFMQQFEDVYRSRTDRRIGVDLGGRKEHPETVYSCEIERPRPAISFPDIHTDAETPFVEQRSLESIELDRHEMIFVVDSLRSRPRLFNVDVPADMIRDAGPRNNYMRRVSEFPAGRGRRPADLADRFWEDFQRLGTVLRHDLDGDTVASDAFESIRRYVFRRGDDLPPTEGLDMSWTPALKSGDEFPDLSNPPHYELFSVFRAASNVVGHYASYELRGLLCKFLVWTTRRVRRDDAVALDKTGALITAVKREFAAARDPDGDRRLAEINRARRKAWTQQDALLEHLPGDWKTS